MAKKVIALVKLQIPAGKATPAPPVGTALGPHGVNIMQFTKVYIRIAQHYLNFEYYIKYNSTYYY